MNNKLKYLSIAAGSLLALTVATSAYAGGDYTKKHDEHASMPHPNEPANIPHPDEHASAPHPDEEKHGGH